MSVSSLPKLDDFKKAIAAVKAANTKYKNAQDSLQPSQTAIDKAKTALDTAQSTLTTLQNDYNNKTYLNNKSYESAYNTYQDAFNKANSLESYWRSRDWLNSDSAYKSATTAYNTAQQKFQSLQDYFNQGKYLQDSSAYQTAVSNQKTAEQKLNTARSYLESQDYLNKNSTYQNYVTAFNTADQKLNQLRDWKDSGRYLEENSTYKNAVNAIPAKEDALRAAENKLDNWTGARSGSSWNSAVSAKIAADTALGNARTAKDKAAEAASNAADTLIRNQDTVRSTAEQNVNKTRDTLRTTAENAVNTAQSAYDAAQPAIDKAQSAAQTLAQNNLDTASKALGTAETNKNIAENKADEIAWNNWQTASKLADTYNGKANTIANGLETVANRAVETQKATVNSQNGIWETAQNKYNDIYNNLQPDLEDYNAKLADVSNYAQTFREGVNDITQVADATTAKNLLEKFNLEIKNSGVPDLQEKVAPLFSGIESPNKISPFALKGANISYFPNVDPTTGLPILNQEKLDALVNKYGDSIKGNSNARGAFDNGFGWNMLSDNSMLLHGPALVGLYEGQYMADAYGKTQKGVLNAQGVLAKDADYLNAAKQLNLNADEYYRPLKFVGASNPMGGVEKATSENSAEYTDPRTGETYLARINQTDNPGAFAFEVDKGKLFADISEKTKDFYMVANALEDRGANTATKHAAVLFRADGNGNLVPVLDEKNQPTINYYDAERVHHSSFMEDWGGLLAIGSMIFAPYLSQYIAGNLAALQVSSAVAPTAFTAGLPAVTLGQTIGTVAVNTIASGVTNSVLSGLTNNGDFSNAGSAFISGAAGSLANTSSNKILDSVGIDQATVGKIAEATNLQPAQVSNMLANSITVGAVGTALGDPDALNKAMTGLAGEFVGSEAQNLVADAMKGADTKLIASVSNAAGNLGNVATQTTLNGGDVNAAITNAMPAIITGAAKAGEAAGKVDGPGTATIEERSTYPEPVPDKYEQIIDAFGNPISKGEQYGDPLAALVGSQVNGTTLSDLSTTKTTSNLPTVFPNGTVQINPNVQYGKIYETTVDGQTVQARDAIRSDGEKVTIYFDPSTGEHATTELIGSVNLSPTLGETKGNILESLTGGKILDYANLTATKKFTLDGDPIVESPSGKFYALKEDGTNKELNTTDLSKSLKLSGKSSNGMPLLESPDGKFYVANTKTNAIEEAKINTLFSFGTPPPEVTNNISLAGTGSTSTINEDKFGLIAQDFGTPEEKLQAITDVETWQKQIQNDPKASDAQKIEAENIVKAIKDANVTNVKPEVKQPDVTPPEVKPPEIKPVDTKPVTPTTAGGSSTAAPTPEPTPQQKADELQKQADAAQTQVLNAANNYIQNPTPENKAKASAAVLNYELAAKIADAAKADLIPKAEIPLPKDSGSTPNQPAGTPAGSQQPSQDGSQQTGTQQPTQTPGTQQPAQPGLPLPAQPGGDQPSQTTSTTPGSGTSNLPGTSTTAGLGGTGTGGTGTSGTGASGTGTGTGTGVGTGTDIAGILSTLAGAFGGVKVPTGGLAQVPAGYTAVTTPLAKRPIGDLYPVSHTMMTPEEIAARSTTKMVRRGGLVSR